MAETFLLKFLRERDRKKRLRKIQEEVVSEVNALESRIQALSDDQLRAKTAEFRQRLAGGESIDELLGEAFAVVREAGRRTLNMRHFDVQLRGGAILHNYGGSRSKFAGRIA